MKKKSRWIYGVIVLLIIIITWFVINKSKSTEHNPLSKTKMTIKVDGLLVTPTSLINEISVSGSLLGFEEVELKNEIAGRVVKINLPEGQFVKKETLLVKLFDDDIQANLKKLQAQLSILEQLCKRQAELLKVNGISQNEYDQSILQMNSIKADIEVQKVLLRKTEILAPFDGVIGLKKISVGAVIEPSTKLATIRRTEKLKLDFSVPEKYSPEIKQGMKVKFTLYDEAHFYDAIVIATEHGIDEDTRSLKVRALVTSPSDQLIPGAFTNVFLSFGENKNAIMIPSEAIIPREQDKSVIVAKNGKAHVVLVKTGVRKATQVEIIEGIQQGDTVITSGILFLKEGSKLIYSNVKTN
jgi:membrane fusion protein, multidrug efflux system